jgi:CRISPR/Cas system-associated protein Cas10 (large subunit of type III CRISPR-Cas system)
MKILICVPVYNRKNITELVLQNLNQYKADAKLWVYNDWSTEYDNEFLKPFCDEVIHLPPSDKIVVKNEKNKNGMGVQHLRWHQFREFASQDVFDFIYFTDSDALHDPNFIDVLKAIYQRYKAQNGQTFPVCLYDTVWHSQPENLLSEGSDVWVRKTAPGISQLYSMEMVRKIVAILNQQDEDPDYAWDYRAQEYLGLPFLTTKISYVEHFGAVSESMHTPQSEWDRDRALNPSQYLRDIRSDIIAYLEGRGPKPGI